MFVMLSEISSVVSPEQPEKADPPIAVTPFGISIDERLEQPEKAPLPICVTPDGMENKPDDRGGTYHRMVPD